MSEAADTARTPSQGGIFSPLAEPVYRRVWTASLFSNLGFLVMGVGAAWEMTRLSTSTEMVALVQTALMLPTMLIALPAGALADMYDHRKIALAGLGAATLFSVILTVIILTGHATPFALLAGCFMIGAGASFYGPAWQASVRELVSRDRLAAAVSLGSISYNAARSIGPAVGGIAVAAAGSVAAFAFNAVSYLPIILALLMWKRRPEPARLPPERLERAILAGMRYALHSRPIRRAIVRALGYGVVGGSVSALAPIAARDLIGGGAAVFGLLLGSFGAGAILGAPFATFFRDRLQPETSASILAATYGLALIAIGASRVIWLSLPAFALAGATWTLLMTQLNVGIQLSAPRWVTARVLSLFQSALTGGIACGAWIWGRTAAQFEVDVALMVSGILLVLSPLLTMRLPLSRVSDGSLEPVAFKQEPQVALALTNRSGPIVVEIDYRIAADDARPFYDAMIKLQRVRQGNGAFDWSLARSISDPEIWTERYQCPTWADYLRQRERFTRADLAIKQAAESYLVEGARPVARRSLDRPFGSVRWRADTPDPRADFDPPFAS